MRFFIKVLSLCLLVLTFFPPSRVWAGEVFNVTVKNGIFNPSSIDVKAGEKFDIDLENKGDWMVEFENLSLHIEKMIAPTQHAKFPFSGLKKGTYEFVDDFFPSGQKFIIRAA